MRRNGRMIVPQMPGTKFTLLHIHQLQLTFAPQTTSSMKNLLYISLISLTFAACSPNNVKEDESLKKFFDDNKVTGSFGMFDNGQGSFILYNRKQFKDSAFLPASTFKIVNALIALETGRVRDDSTLFKWDGVQRPITNWNQDLTLRQAFQYSSVPVFQQIARNIGKDTMQQWLDSLGYARRYNRAVIKTIDSFWLDNSIKITADEQLGLVKRLYFDQLPFQKRPQRIVRDMMLMEDNANYKLSYKTGWGFAENGESIGWIIGWIEENKHPYPFVLQIKAPHNADVAVIRMNILKGILKQMGFMQGKR